MKLYRYMSFESPYWDDLIRNNRLWFSSVSLLRDVNDRHEFSPNWNSHSGFWKFAYHSLKPNYENLFNHTMTACLSKSLNRHCWREFSKSNGVVYEFDFSSFDKNPSVTGKSIEYVDRKISNVPGYVDRELQDRALARALRKRGKLDQHSSFRIMTWVNSHQAKDLLESHIYHLAFTKVQKFKLEDEYRYVHLTQNIGSTVGFAPLVSGCLQLNQLGLQLRAIHTNDMLMVASFARKVSIVQIPSW